ncbi:MAG TPA: hypothetical protein DEP71_09815, partial [Porphyromonadaceae bacterium]|nr:hypothetical protein [Porphyromonadaceae bacterium]
MGETVIPTRPVVLVIKKFLRVKFFLIFLIVFTYTYSNTFKERSVYYQKCMFIIKIFVYSSIT